MQQSLVMKREDGHEHLSDDEIEAILAREAAGLPPEPDQPVQPLQMARQEPGQGRFGRWAVWLIIGFILLGVLQTMR